MKKFFSMMVVIIMVATNSTAQESIYLDPARTLDERARDLVSKLTLEEKVGQMMYNAPEISRLNIPAYNWWNESLHGVARSGVATIFPQAIGMAAAFDDDLMFRISTAVSDEARAMYNASIAKGYHRQYAGLTFWTPNINIFRDPRWGRGQETYGEDPYLTSRLGVAYVKGLQGDNPDYLKAAACAKHYAVHSGPERLRHEFDAQASLKDLQETYLPAFKSLVDAGVEAVMCAYNRTNGEPCCGNEYLLNTMLRQKWGFKGHIVSDCWALVDFHAGHKVTANAVESAALALKRGVNLNCGSVYFPNLIEAVKQGLVTEKQIDEALITLFRTRFKLGLFDPPGKNPYDKISTDVINSDEHRALAREAAVKSIVMLKNNGALPLKNDLPYYYVTGPNAGNIDALIGNYYGVNNNIVTILEGISGAIQPGSQLQYKIGVLLDRDNVNPIDWTTGDAKRANATIVVLGISGLIEGEEGESISSPHYGDRLDYNIPKNQIDFLKKLKDGNKNPVIAVITGGSPMNLSEVHELADAVLLIWYPGEEGGNAVADIIFGKKSPSGKLPITFPKSLEQLPPYDDYSMVGRTYRYMTAEPMYPFGFGLSYGKFEYSNLKLSATKLKKNQPVEAEVTVTNAGNVAADEVVQLYITDVKGSTRTPLYSLKDFRRISVDAGQSTVVKFTITPAMMTLINEKGEGVVEAGEFKISIGGSLPGKRSQDLGSGSGVEGVFTLR
jgi:beta-glucosidase